MVQVTIEEIRERTE